MNSQAMRACALDIAAEISESLLFKQKHEGGTYQAFHGFTPETGWIYIINPAMGPSLIFPSTKLEKPFASLFDSR